MDYFIILILFALVRDSLAELCLSSSRYSYYSYYTYCSGGCCGGYYYDQYCCSSLEVGTIAGIVIGCIFALAIIIVVVICICAQCNKKKTGVVVSTNRNTNPQPQNTVAFVSTSTYNTQPVGYVQPPPAYPPPNQLYGPSAYPPGTSDPAYPPPNTAPPAYPGTPQKN
ncbi:uncharacterized protein [Argopecten irradians]|uniref:uncharacterized protein n=1 Tax=Argopecten irradians TaxID=31199 RepID=UPI00371F8C0F